jgi:uncharacterized protein HemX
VGIQLKLNTFIGSIIGLWLASAILTLMYGDINKAGNFGDSFGAINALFSGIALGLAIYSMILQQKQNAEFEQKTLVAMKQQTETIEIVKSSLMQQANVAKITALTYLVDRQNQRIEKLKEWGEQTHKNEYHYSKGIDAAEARIAEYETQIKMAAAN